MDSNGFTAHPELVPKNDSGTSDSQGMIGSSETIGSSDGQQRSTGTTIAGPVTTQLSTATAPLQSQQATPTTSAHSSRQASPVKPTGSPPTTVVQFPLQTVSPPQQPQLIDPQLQLHQVTQMECLGGTPIVTITSGDITKTQVVKTKKGRFHVLQDAPMPPDAGSTGTSTLSGGSNSQAPSPIPPLHHKSERSTSNGTSNGQQQENGVIRKGRFTLTSAVQGDATTIARQVSTQNVVDTGQPPHPAPVSPAGQQISQQLSQQHFQQVHHPLSSPAVQQQQQQQGVTQQTQQISHVSIPSLQHPAQQPVVHQPAQQQQGVAQPTLQQQQQSQGITQRVQQQQSQQLHVVTQLAPQQQQLHMGHQPTIPQPSVQHQQGVPAPIQQRHVQQQPPVSAPVQQQAAVQIHPSGCSSQTVVQHAQPGTVHYQQLVAAPMQQHSTVVHYQQPVASAQPVQQQQASTLQPVIQYQQVQHGQQTSTPQPAIQYQQVQQGQQTSTPQPAIQYQQVQQGQQTSTTQPAIQYQQVQQHSLQQQQQQNVPPQQAVVQFHQTQQSVLPTQQVTTIVMNSAAYLGQQQAPSPAVTIQQVAAKVGTPPPTPGREIIIEKVDASKPRNLAAKPPASFDSKPPSSFDSKGVGSSVGLGKVFYFLEQMKAEVTEADRTIKSLNTDMKCLRDKNKELEAKLRETEKRWIDEKTSRESAEARVKALKKKAREIRELRAADNDTLDEDQAPLAGEFIAEPLLTPKQSNASRSNSLASLEEMQQHKRNSVTTAAINTETIPLERSSTPMKAVHQATSIMTDQLEAFSPKLTDATVNHVAKLSDDAIKSSPLRQRLSSDQLLGVLSLNGASGQLPNNIKGSDTTPVHARALSSDTFDPLKSNTENANGDDKVSLGHANVDLNGGRTLHSTQSRRLQISTQMGQHVRQQSTPNVMLGHMTMDAMSNMMTKDSVNNQTAMGYLQNTALQQQVQGSMMMNQNSLMSQMGGMSHGNGLVGQGMQQGMMGGLPVQGQGIGQGLSHIQQQLPNVHQMQNAWSQQQQYPISQQQQQQQQQQWVQQTVYQQDQQMVNQQQQMMQAAQQQHQQMFPQNQFQQTSTQYGQQAGTMNGQQSADPFNTLASRQQQATQQSQLWNSTGS